jgi:hypothetical protein
MPSQPQSSSANDALINDRKDKQQAEWSFTTGADALTNEEREDERNVISHARPGGLERVASQQRLPAEGIGAVKGDLRHAYTHLPEQDSVIKRIESGEYAGERDEQDAGRGTPDAEPRDDIRC